MRALRIIFTVLLWALPLTFAGAEPHWWGNPRMDDDFDMYERGHASAAANRDEALRQARRNAKDLLADRLGMLAALQEAGYQPSPDLAITNVEYQGEEVEQRGKTWEAWVLLRYPMDEKRALMKRWEAALALYREQNARKGKIPVQFKLSLASVDGRNQYREGDSLSFVIEAERDCYVLLFDHQSDGTSVLLFPNRYQPDGFVRKGQKIVVPNPANPRFRFVVRPPWGDDRLELIASTVKGPLYTRFSDMLAGLEARQDMVYGTRGIFIEEIDSLGQTTPGDSSTGVKMLWSRAELNVSTFAR